MSFAPQRSLLPILLLLASRVASQSTLPEDGAMAPANRWPMRDGCAARTASSVAGGIEGEAGVAWKWTTKGELEGEPVVWDDIVVLVDILGPKERFLHIVNLKDGKTLTKRRFAVEVPLEPTIVGKTVWVRLGNESIQALTVGRDTLTPRWTWTSPKKTIASPPLVFDNEIYVLDGRAIVRLKEGATTPIWTKDGGFGGRLSLRGKNVYALTYAMNRTTVVALDRATGKAAGEGVLEIAENFRSADSESRVFVFDKHIVTRHKGGLADQFEGTPPNAVWWRRIATDDAVSFSKQTPIALACDPSAWRDGFIASMREADNSPILATTMSAADEKSIKKSPNGPILPLNGLASGDFNPDFALIAGGVSQADDLLFLGARVIDATTGEIIVEPGQKPTMRAIPARETLLVVESPQSLIALRRAKSAEPASFTMFGPEKSERVAVAGGTVVFADGAVSSGDIEVDPAKRTILRPSGTVKKQIPLDDVVLLLDKDKRVLHAAGVDAAIHGADILSMAVAADAIAKLAQDAVAAGDLSLADELLDEARISGASDGAIAAAQKIRDAADKKAPTADAAKIAAVKDELRSIERSAADRLWKMYGSLPETASSGLRFDLLRRVFAADPAHPGASDLVKSLVPKEVTAGATFRGSEWVDFAEVAMRSKFAYVAAPDPKSTASPTNIQREIGALAADWKRSDIAGFQSDRLLVIAPTSWPGRLARCIAIGEFTCEILETMFSKGPNVRSTKQPMIVQIYESRKEFLARQIDRVPKELKAAAAAEVSKIAGYFDAKDDRSRFYLAEDDEEFRQVMTTTAHELTHHWILDRCPLIKTTDWSKSFQSPGYWIVEGFATFIEEMRFDLRNRRWNPFNARAHSLDVVANADESQILPWRDFYILPNAAMPKLLNAQFPPVALRTRLGGAALVNGGNMFYAQASATCHYLWHADGGKYRDKLFEIVGRHYLGQTTPMEIQEVLGVPADKFGERVQAWAKAVIGGKMKGDDVWR